MPCTTRTVHKHSTEARFSEYFVAKLLASSVRHLAFHLSFRPKGGREVFTGEQFKEGSSEGEKKLHEHNRSGKRGRGGDGDDGGGNSFKSILHQFQPDYHPSSPLLRMSPKGGGWGALVTGKRKRGRRLEESSQGWVHGSELPPSSLPNSRNGQQNLRWHDQGQKIRIRIGYVVGGGGLFSVNLWRNIVHS